jgi:hypothetical protein
MMAELSVVHSELVYDQIRSSNNQLQRTGLTVPWLSKRCSPAAELERSEDPPIASMISRSCES